MREPSKKLAPSIGFYSKKLLVFINVLPKHTQVKSIEILGCVECEP